MPSANFSYTDVLVIGAGPSGLMAALALGRLGVTVRVAERREAGTLYGHADGLQPRTLEIWNSYDILNNILSKAAPMNAMVTYSSTPDGSRLLRSEPENNIVVKARYPYELGIAINEIEGTLRSAAEESGVIFEHSTIPTAMELVDAEYPVKVNLKHTGNLKGLRRREWTSTIYAKYVIGADGAYSWVRRTLNIPMVGDQTEYIWGVADVVVETDFPDTRFKTIIRANSGTLITVPREDDKIRLYVQLSTGDISSIASKANISSNGTNKDHEDLVLKLARERMYPYTVQYKKIFWSTIFSVGQRVATQFSYQNRIFIVGDACHTHSPKAGQGANVSMGDAHNLAWKLAYVIKGWGKPELLHTYEKERKKCAEDLIEFDKEIFNVANNGSADDYKRTLHKQNLFSSGVGIRYTDPALTHVYKSNSAAKHLRCGERLPPSSLVRLADWKTFDIQDICPSDGLFKLYIFPGDIQYECLRENLNRFSSSLQSYSGDNGVVHERIRVYTILIGNKKQTNWKDVPDYLANLTWKCIFIASKPEFIEDNIYHVFGISAGPDSSGSAVLVRPDGYISYVGVLDEHCAGTMVDFVGNI